MKRSADYLLTDAIRPRNSDDASANAGHDSFEGRKRSIGSGSLLIVVGLIFLATSLGLPFGSVRSPGPGLWPLIVSLALLVLGALVALERQPLQDDEESGEELGRVILGYVSLAAFAVVFWYLGYFASTLLLVLGVARYFGKAPWRWAIVIALCAATGIQVFFGFVLGLPSPSGI